MSSVSAAASPLNLGFGDSHKRDRHPARRQRHSRAAGRRWHYGPIDGGETDDDDQDLLLAVAAKSGATGVYALTVTANEE